MKKKHLFLKFGVLTASVLLTACASRDDIDELAGVDEQGVVKAQFNISIPQTSKSATRTTPEIVQLSEGITGFRGIQNIYLLPYIAESSTASIEDESSKGSIVLRQMIKPTGITMQANTIPSKTLIGTSKSVLFGDVELTIGTNRFLFYGEAIPKAAADGGNDFMNGGVIVKNNGTVLASPTVPSSIKPANLEFSPKQIGKTSGDGTKEEAILNYLKLIAQAQVSSTDTWSGTSNLDLKILYNNFTGQETGTPHKLQGSSLYLQASIQELYETMIAKRASSTLANAVCQAIENNTYVNNTYVFYTATDEEVIAGTKKVGDLKASGSLTFKDDILGYPENLPDGSAMIIYDTVNKTFKYAGGHDYSNGELVLQVDDETDLAAINRYVYPASLYYMAESTIKTSTQSQADVYDGEKTWTEVLENYDSDTGSDAIRSSTRSIALENPVNYAVGRFDVKVKAASGGTNTTQIKDAKDGTVLLSDLELTGVLVGQQRSSNWQFEAKNDSYEYIIYDNVKKSCGKTFSITTSDPADNSFTENVSTGTVTYGTQNYDHVLVFPTRKYIKSGTTSSGDQKVKVVLEFRNKGPEFVGKDGRIPTGCKFYLIGELDMDKISGENKKIDYIFQKDYITTANFTIGNLKKAIRAIPDLRNPEIELGLSVDLHWEQGNIFNPVIE